MATRGTYRIDGTLTYNHWDNYPAGTALQLLEVVKTQHGLSLFDCIRGMAGLRPADSIYDGPAQYHYVLQHGRITVYKIISDDQMTLTNFVSVVIEDWINYQIMASLKAGDLTLSEGETEAHVKVVKFKGGYYTGEQLYSEGRQKFERGRYLMGEGHIGNASCAFREAFEMLAASGVAHEEQKSEWPEIARALADKYNHHDPDYFMNYSNPAAQDL